MELKQFISETLINITQGVEEANKKSKRFKLASGFHDKLGSGQEVEFDVQLNVSRDSKDEINGKIGIALASISSDIKQSEVNQNTHRMKFKVFITENESPPVKTGFYINNLPAH